MSFAPSTVQATGFQDAWIQVSNQLMHSHWELRNLMVHIQNPCFFNPAFDKRVFKLAKDCDILNPKQVAYTIFPHNLKKRYESKEEFFNAYNKKHGLFDRLHFLKKGEWGTYFQRMTHYESLDGEPVNQLNNIIEALRTRKTHNKACYTIVIQKPGSESIRPLGGPCLNYIAVQGEFPKDEKPVLGLLAVYRNHDFLERAYGNYWGLCNLLNFLAEQVDGVCGPLTCISSHAYVDKKKTEFKSFLESK